MEDFSFFSPDSQVFTACMLALERSSQQILKNLQFLDNNTPKAIPLNLGGGGALFYIIIEKEKWQGRKGEGVSALGKLC